MPQDTPSGQPNPLQPGEFIPSAPANAVSFKTANVDLPSSLYIQRDDQLTISAISQFVGEQVIFNWRLLLPNGYIQTGQFTLRIAVVTGLVTQTIPLAEGFLLAVSASPQSSSLSRGQTFASAKITRGAGGATVVETLFADYVTLNVQTGWPGGRQTNSIEGPGAMTSVQPAGLPANSWSLVNANQQACYLRAFWAHFIASAVAATRVPQIGLQNASAVQVATFEPNGTVLASGNVIITGGTPSITQPASVTDIIIGLPTNLLIPSQWSIFSTGTNIQAGDSYNSVLLVLEYLVQI